MNTTETPNTEITTGQCEKKYKGTLGRQESTETERIEYKLQEALREGSLLLKEPTLGNIYLNVHDHTTRQLIFTIDGTRVHLI